MHDIVPCTRQAISQLINLAGGTYTPALTQQNAFLVCKTKEGKKYDKAVQWNVPRCSSKWLEGVYKEWKLQPHLLKKYRIPDPDHGGSMAASKSAPADIKFAITGIDASKRAAMLDGLARLGASEVAASAASHLIADSIKQTSKFVEAISGCQHIVTSEWVAASIDAGVFLDESAFELRDPIGEAKLDIADFDLVVERKRNIYGCRGLLAGQTYLVTGSVVPQKATVEAIILSAGGQVVESAADLGALGLKPQTDVKLITCTADFRLPQFMRWKVAFTTDLLLSGVLRQQMDFTKNIVHRKM
jgi:NAD-dependent DNA ligase